MATRAVATIRLKVESEKQLATLLAALGPETKMSSTRRATITVGRDGLFLVLTADACDTVALRSTLNAYLRWIASVFNVITSVEQG